MQIVLSGLEPGQVVTVRGVEAGAEVELEGCPPLRVELDSGRSQTARIRALFVRVAPEQGDDLLEQLKQHGARRITMDEITHGALARLLERVESIAARLEG